MGSIKQHVKKKPNNRRRNVASLKNDLLIDQEKDVKNVSSNLTASASKILLKSTDNKVVKKETDQCAQQDRSGKTKLDKELNYNCDTNDITFKISGDSHTAQVNITSQPKQEVLQKPVSIVKPIQTLQLDKKLPMKMK